MSYPLIMAFLLGVALGVPYGGWLMLRRIDRDALTHGDCPQTVDSEVNPPVPPDRKGSQ